MRDVEVAAAEALDGPTDEELDAIRAATFTVDAINEREKILDHDTAAFVDVLAASAGPAGRWIHYGLTSSDVVDTGLALQLRRAGELLVPRAARSRGSWPRRRASTRTRCASAARTACTPSRRRSASSSPATRWRRTATRSGWSARSTRSRPRSPAPSARSRRSGPDYEERVLDRLGLDAEPISTQVVPRDRHAELLQRDRARRRRASSASRPRSATCSAPRCARSRSRSAQARRARARCRTSATRSCASASAGSRACCAATPRSGWRTSRCGTSATSRTRAPSGSCCPTRRSCSTRCWRSTCASCAA